MYGVSQLFSGTDYLRYCQVLVMLMYLKHMSTQAAQSANIHNPFSGPFNPITDTGNQSLETRVSISAFLNCIRCWKTMTRMTTAPWASDPFSLHDLALPLLKEI